MSVEAEESCPKERLEEMCRQSTACRELLAKYEACEERVRSRPGTTETCVEELFALTERVDKCVRPERGWASGRAHEQVLTWGVGVATFI